MLVVPEKTIAFVPLTSFLPSKKISDISTFIKPLNTSHERFWFTQHFYKCLPLSIGNMQGLSYSVPFDFSVLWNGDPHKDGLTIKIHEETVEDELHLEQVQVSSHFGYGIFTTHIPFILKTPPGISLMTIAPPNFPLPGISPMTGVVETDNLNFTFTLNFKVDLTDIPIRISKNYPIMGMLPIYRNFSDSFSLVNAYDIFEHEDIKHELLDKFEQYSKDRIEYNKKIHQGETTKSNNLYYKGIDIDGSKFSNHQIPRKNK